jgi:hypothetical protein
MRVPVFTLKSIEKEEERKGQCFTETN